MMEYKKGKYKFQLTELKNYHVFILLFVIAFVLRFFSFFPSLINHDESTYLVIAKEILKGKVLYTDITDIKSPGIFYITAGYLKLFGDSIFGYRVFGAFIITLTSFILYRTKLRIGHGRSVALATGIIYIFFLSVWTQYGVPLNTEHFFNLFTALALLVFFSFKSSWRYYLTGFVMGIGFLIKIVVVFDMTAFFLFFILTDIINKELTFKRIGIYFISGIFFLMPFGLVNLGYFITGNYGDFYQINYEAFSHYPRQKEYFKSIVWILSFFARFLPISALFFWSLFSKQKTENLIIKEKLLISLWFLFCLISVLLPSKRFSHYLIQLMLPVSVLAGNIFHPDVKKPAILQILFTRKIGYSILGIFIIINIILQKKDYFDKPDCPRLAADYLEKNIEHEDIVYTCSTLHIIYYLLDVSPPTKYVHPSLLYVEEHYLTLDIDPKAELKKILTQNPKFIITQKKIPNRIINEYLQNDYLLIKSIGECQVNIYQRKPV